MRGTLCRGSLGGSGLGSWALAASAVVCCAGVALGQLQPALRGIEASPDNSYLVRVATPRPMQLRSTLRDLGFGTDCGASVVAGGLELIASGSEVVELTNMGLAPVVVRAGQPFAKTQAEMGLADLQIAPDAPPTGYSDLAGVYAQMNALVAAAPSIAKVVNVTQLVGGPKTVEGRDLFAVVISDNVSVDENEPARLVVSCHHAREIITPVLALDAIQRLTTGYASDPAIQAIVNNNEVWIMPMCNPDGYNHVFTVNDFWRKNRRNNGGGAFGVDQNRNYNIGWNNACGGSTDPTSETYRGPSAGSEAETQVIVALSQLKRFATVLDFHSFGSYTLRSYTCFTHPWTNFWSSEASAVSTAHGYGGANQAPSALGEHYEWQFANFGSLSFLTETYTEFQPPFSEATAHAVQVWPGTRLMLQRPISISGTVTDASSGTPINAAVSIVGTPFPNGETNSSGGQFGRYHWILPPGNYQLQFTAPCYQSVTISVNNVTTTSSAVQNVQMTPVGGAGALAFAYPSGTPATINANGGTSFGVNVSGICGGVPQPNSGVLHVSTGGGPFVQYPMVQGSPNSYTATFPAVPCTGPVSYYVSAKNSLGDTKTDPPSAPATVFTATPTTGVQVAFEDNFQTNKGWTTEVLAATAGFWERGVPVNDPNWDYDPATDGDGSGSCFLTQNQAGNTDVDNGAVRLTSPVFDFAGPGGELSYWYYNYLTNTTGGVDALLVEISTSGTGGPWIELNRHTANNALAWTKITLTAANLASKGVTPSATTVLRFTSNDGNPQSIVESGVDGVLAQRTVCQASCYPDCDQSGTLNIFDYICFGQAYAAQQSYADCDQSGTLNIFDYICFGQAYAAGCP